MRDEVKMRFREKGRTVTPLYLEIVRAYQLVKVLLRIRNVLLYRGIELELELCRSRQVFPNNVGSMIDLVEAKRRQHEFCHPKSWSAVHT